MVVVVVLGKEDSLRSSQVRAGEGSVATIAADLALQRLNIYQNCGGP